MAVSTPSRGRARHERIQGIGDLEAASLEPARVAGGDDLRAPRAGDGSDLPVGHGEGLARATAPRRDLAVDGRGRPVEGQHPAA